LKELPLEWGLGDRVRFEGWIGRPDLIPQLACAGVLIHPALTKKRACASPRPLPWGLLWWCWITGVLRRSSGSGEGLRPRSCHREAPKRRPKHGSGDRHLPGRPSTYRSRISAGGHHSKANCWRRTSWLCGGRRPPSRRGPRCRCLAIRPTDHLAGVDARLDRSSYGRDRSSGSRSSRGRVGLSSESSGIARSVIDGAISDLPG
jgi:hypothetical protein